MENLQAYLFEHKEDFKENHYLELMKIMEESYRTNTSLYNITFLMPTLSHEGNSMEFTIARTWAALTNDDEGYYKKNGTLKTKVLLDMESLSMWVSDASESMELQGPIELEVTELPVLQVAPPPSQS